MKKKDQRKEPKLAFVGTLFTSALILAAFTYSTQEFSLGEETKEKNKAVVYQFEQFKEKKPIETKTQQVKKPVKKEKTIKLDKKVDENSKASENSSKKIDATVDNGDLDLKFGEEVDYGVVDITPEIVDFPDIEASFVGGFGEMTRFIVHNLHLNRLDELAYDSEILVHVEFIVSSEGIISDVKTVEEISGSLEREITRMIRSMPSWQPAELKGRKVHSRVHLPIRIDIQ